MFRRGLSHPRHAQFVRAVSCSVRRCGALVHSSTVLADVLALLRSACRTLRHVCSRKGQEGDEGGSWLIRATLLPHNVVVLYVPADGCASVSTALFWVGMRISLLSLLFCSLCSDRSCAP